MTSRRQLYALGEPFGDSVTKTTFGKHRIYGGGDDDGGGGTSVTKQEIPAELKPLASAYTTKAIGLSNQGFQPYYGQRYADLNGTQMAGVNMAASRALNGSQTMKNAESFMNTTMNGGNQTNVMANPYAGMNNPYLNSAIDNAMGDVSTRVNSQFSGSNYGTTAHQGTLAEELGNVANTMRMQDYGMQQQLAENAVARNLEADQFDMGNRMAAMQYAPTFGNEAYNNANQLMNAGQVLQDQQQQNLDFAYQQFAEQQDLPYKQLAAMSGVFGSNLGGSSTTQQSGGGGGK